MGERGRGRDGDHHAGWARTAGAVGCGSVVVERLPIKPRTSGALRHPRVSHPSPCLAPFLPSFSIHSFVSRYHYQASTRSQTTSGVITENEMIRRRCAVVEEGAYVRGAVHRARPRRGDAAGVVAVESPLPGFGRPRSSQLSISSAAPVLCPCAHHPRSSDSSSSHPPRTTARTPTNPFASTLLELVTIDGHPRPLPDRHPLTSSNQRHQAACRRPLSGQAALRMRALFRRHRASPSRNLAYMRTHSAHLAIHSHRLALQTFSIGSSGRAY